MSDDCAECNRPGGEPFPPIPFPPPSLPALPLMYATPLLSDASSRWLTMEKKPSCV